MAAFGVAPEALDAVDVDAFLGKDGVVWIGVFVDPVVAREAGLAGNFGLGLLVGKVADTISDKPSGRSVLKRVGHLVSHVVGHMSYLPACVGAVGWELHWEPWDIQQGRSPREERRPRRGCFQPQPVGDV